MRENLRDSLREGFEEHLDKTVPPVTEPVLTEPVTEPVPEPVTKEASVQDEIKNEIILAANVISESSLLLGISLGLYLPSLAKYILGSTLLLPTLILVKNNHWFTKEDKEKWLSLLSLVTLSGILNAYIISHL
jgi:hypothetical protein